MAATAHCIQVSSTPMETHAERVAGHRGEGHYAGHGVGMEADLHQVLADAACGGVGFGVEGARERLDDRIEDAASSSGRGRRHGGRDDEFCETDRIAERRGAPADRLNDAKRNAAAEPHLDEAAREEERADDELDRAVAEAHQRALRLQNAEEGA